MYCTVLYCTVCGQSDSKIDASSSRAEVFESQQQSRAEVLRAEADVERAVERLAHLLSRRQVKRAHQGHFANFLIG